MRFLMCVRSLDINPSGLLPCCPHPESEEQQLTLLNGGNLVCLGIGDLDTKLLLDSHDDFYSVERVESKVRGESGSWRELCVDR
jgi:hypothetical protein